MRMAAMAVLIGTVIAAVVVTALAQRPSPTTQPGEIVTLEVVYEKTVQAEKYARWSAVLAGLALAGVIVAVWSMRTLARNQVQLAQLVTGRPITEP